MTHSIWEPEIGDQVSIKSLWSTGSQGTIKKLSRHRVNDETGAFVSQPGILGMRWYALRDLEPLR